MARKPTQTQPADMPGQPEHSEILLLLQEMRDEQKPADLTPILAHLKRLEEGQAEMIVRQNRMVARQDEMALQQATAEQRQDDRITERVAPLSIRGITAAERVIETLESLPVQIEQAGHQASQEMARNSLFAKRLIEGVETAAFIRMQAMRDQATAMVQEVQDHAISRMEKAKDEAVVILQGMGNAAKNMVASSAVSIAEKLKEVARLGVTLLENTTATAQSAIKTTATEAAAEYIKATADAKRAFDLSAACVVTFEENMTRLERVGLWLDDALTHRTRQIARASGVRMAMTLSLAAIIYRGTVWALGGTF